MASGTGILWLDDVWLQEKGAAKIRVEKSLTMLVGKKTDMSVRYGRLQGKYCEFEAGRQDFAKQRRGADVTFEKMRRSRGEGR